VLDDLPLFLQKLTSTEQLPSDLQSRQDSQADENVFDADSGLPHVFDAALANFDAGVARW